MLHLILKSYTDEGFGRNVYKNVFFLSLHIYIYICKLTLTLTLTLGIYIKEEITPKLCNKSTLALYVRANNKFQTDPIYA